MGTTILKYGKNDFKKRIQTKRQKTDQKIFEAHVGNYGYRRIAIELRNQEHIVNHNKVLCIMKKLNITCTKFTRKPRKFSTYKGTVGKLAKNRRFNTPIPLQKITTDTTEFKICTIGANDKVIIKKD